MTGVFFLFARHAFPLRSPLAPPPLAPRSPASSSGWPAPRAAPQRARCAPATRHAFFPFSPRAHRALPHTSVSSSATRLWHLTGDEGDGGGSDEVRDGGI
jgi:hypothetical protein